jgi:hypothetical protein
VQFLLERLEQSGPELASSIVEAMQMYRRDESVRDRVGKRSSIPAAMPGFQRCSRDDLPEVL